MPMSQTDFSPSEQQGLQLMTNVQQRTSFETTHLESWSQRRQVPLSVVFIAASSGVLLILATIYLVMVLPTLRVRVAPSAQSLDLVGTKALAGDAVINQFARTIAASTYSWSTKDAATMVVRMEPFLSPKIRLSFAEKFKANIDDAVRYGRSNYGTVLAVTIAARRSSGATLRVAIEAPVFVTDSGRPSFSRFETLVVTYEILQDVVTPDNPFGIVVVGLNEMIAADFLKTDKKFW